MLPLILLATACVDHFRDTNSPQDTNEDTAPIDTQETDSDTDTDSDIDTDSDADADTDADTDSDADCDSYNSVIFPSTPTYTFTGSTDGVVADGLGSYVSVGDIDDDGTSEIVLGVTSHQESTYGYEGALYSIDLTSVSLGEQAAADAAEMSFIGAVWGGMGEDATAQDIDGDGIKDLFFYYAGLGGTAFIKGGSIANRNYDFSRSDLSDYAGLLTGARELTFLGDINGDGIQDAVYGSGAECEIRSLDPSLLTAGGVMQWSDLELVTSIRDESDNDSRACDNVAAVNYDGNTDGYKSLLLGNSRTGTTGLGKVWLVKNDGDLPSEITIEGDVFVSSWISGAEYFVFNGINAGAEAGETLSAGMFNDDACEDFVIGALYETNGHSEAGGAYSFDGCALRDKALPSGSAIELSEAGLNALGPNVGRVMYGAEDNDEVPVSIAFSQDSVCPDLSMLAISSATGYGAVYPVSRSTWETLPVRSTVESADQEIEGEDYLGEFGRTILMSDVSGDSTADLIVAVPNAEDGTGKVKIYLGERE